MQQDWFVSTWDREWEFRFKQLQNWEFIHYLLHFEQVKLGASATKLRVNDDIHYQFDSIKETVSSLDTPHRLVKHLEIPMVFPLWKMIYFDDGFCMLIYWREERVSKKVFIYIIVELYILYIHYIYVCKYIYTQDARNHPQNHLHLFFFGVRCVATATTLHLRRSLSQGNQWLVKSVLIGWWLILINTD